MNLDKLLKPRSIAIVGASQNPSVSTNMIRSLERMRFEGEIYPINPKYEEVLGYRCYPGLEDLPSPADLVAFSIGPTRLESEVKKAAAHGIGAGVVFSGGFGEAGEEGVKMQTRIAALCREAQIALCGPNCMGVLSPHSRSTAYMMEVVDVEGITGNVGLVSQSGSVCIGLSGDVRRYGFSHIISSGNEAVVSSAAYLEYLAADPNTAVIALFSESITEPSRFVAALDQAAEAGKPVVAVKVGKSPRAASAVRTHTGGLAGESRVFSELLRAHRAIEVDDIEALCEVLAVCQGERWPAGPRLSVITASGGHAELILDVAEHGDVILPPLPEPQREEIESVVGPLTGDGNPVDAWGLSGDGERNFPCALKVLGDSPSDYDAVLFTLDGTDEPTTDYHGFASIYADMIGEAAKDSTLAYYLLSTRHGVFQSDITRRLRERGIPSVGGIDKGMQAVAKLGRLAGAWSDMIEASGKSRDVLTGQTVRTSINEYDAKRFLTSAGLPITEERLAATRDEALRAAEELGYPVALKVVSDEIAHRTELGLVHVGLDDAAQLKEALAEMETRLDAFTHRHRRAGFLVQAMVDPGVEVIAGVQRDESFGLFLMAGVGGVLTEFFDEIALRALPLRQGDVETMIDETSLGELLAGVRGRPKSDREALHDALYALADFAVDNDSALESIDVNPLVVHEEGRGCVAVDALIVGRQGLEGPNPRTR